MKSAADAGQQRKIDVDERKSSSPSPYQAEGGEEDAKKRRKIDKGVDDCNAERAGSQHDRRTTFPQTSESATKEESSLLAVQEQYTKKNAEASAQERRLAASGIEVPKRLVEFPAQLMELLQRDVAPDAMRFLPEGEAIAFNKDTFTEKVLDVYFRGMKFNSFVRNMNRWGFRRISHPSLKQSECGYHHLLFKKDSPDLAKCMKKDSNATEVVRQLDLADSKASKSKDTTWKTESVQQSEAKSGAADSQGAAASSAPEDSAGLSQQQYMPRVNTVLREGQYAEALSDQISTHHQQQQMIWQKMMQQQLGWQQQQNTPPATLGLIQGQMMNNFAGNPIPSSPGLMRGVSGSMQANESEYFTSHPHNSTGLSQMNQNRFGQEAPDRETAASQDQNQQQRGVEDSPDGDHGTSI